jgi:hypothetical protein
VRQWIGRHYANVVATLALFLVLTGVGAAAAGKVQLVTGKQIKNGSITSKDLADGGVRSPDIKTGAVTSSDLKNGGVTSADIGADQVKTADIAPNQITGDEIAPGEVGPDEVTMPAPQQFTRPANEPASATVGGEFAKVADIATFQKSDGASKVQIDWTGTASAPNLECAFQVRVDGAASNNGGQVYVPVGQSTSVAAAVLFDGLAPGTHQIQVWARTLVSEGPCIVGPERLGIGQTFVVTEKIM